MLPSDRRGRSVCPACGGPTRAPALCPECAEAFALARRAHPATVSALIPFGLDPTEPTVSDDVDLWDAWSLLGDVGGRPMPVAALGVNSA